MAPSLRISSGPSVSSLEIVAVNHADKPFTISSDSFQGRIVVRIKNFTGEDPQGVSKQADDPYFSSGYGKGMTWSMQIQGRFLKKINADNLVFGNEFDKPIKDCLPYGTSLALQFAKVIDPNLTHDLYADKPWAFSPYLATMSRLSSKRVEKKDDINSWPKLETYITDDVTSLFQSADGKLDTNIKKDQDLVNNVRGGDESIEKAHEFRRRYFGNKSHREKVVITDDQVIAGDFFNAFVNFNDLTLHVPFSGGLSFDLKKYWDGQPVRYVCKDKTNGTVFFVIQLDITYLDK